MKAIRVLALTFVTIGLLGVSYGCNTTKGAGKDMERAGDKIQNSAERHGASE